jgi:molecular chaperone GrpE
MYLQAEMENSRKYYLKQYDVVRNRSKIDIITQFTPLLDSLDFAVKNSNNIKDKFNDPQIATFIKGFENLKQSIMNIFQSLGVTQIDAINKHFDFTIHEAVQTVEKTDIPDETIIQVVQPGYLLNRDVIRPAKVVIAKHPQPPPPPVEVQKEKLPTSTEEKKEKKENPSK